ncbi:hypothetical protein CALVIDRAFT_225631 [Calocera viscosa TUFC12733]|uniref:Uncharacterized protein n=1 Tax=Calocera viscosa (strain TUFC12733) TaxID=1330018 RepID=A0A167K0Y0_CALVF|nr:hypothetical protein CALVIDRAFT_225631 [Calocera viscosa TUFC12733]
MADIPPNTPLLLPRSLYLSLRTAKWVTGGKKLYLYFSYDGWKGFRTKVDPTSSGGYVLDTISSVEDRITNSVLIFLRIATFSNLDTARDLYNKAAASFNGDVANGTLEFENEAATMTAFLDVLHRVGMTLAPGATLIQQAQIQALAPQNVGANPANIVDAFSGVAVLA